MHSYPYSELSGLSKNVYIDSIETSLILTFLYPISVPEPRKWPKGVEAQSRELVRRQLKVGVAVNAYVAYSKRIVVPYSRDNGHLMLKAQEYSHIFCLKYFLHLHLSWNE